MELQKTPTGHWTIKLDVPKGIAAKTTLFPHANCKNGLHELVSGRYDISHMISSSDLANKNTPHTHATLNLIIKKGCDVILFEELLSSFTYDLTITLDESSTLSYFRSQVGSSRVKTTFIVEKNAHLSFCELLTKTTESENSVVLKEGSFATILSIPFLEKNIQSHARTNVLHETHSESLIHVKPILFENATCIVDGAITIPENAPKSSANERVDALLLHHDAQIKSSPQLFIHNNDVVCSHAATSTRVDESLEFYLMTRGLSKEDAQSLLLRAFLWSAIERLPEQLQKMVAPKVLELIDNTTSALQENAEHHPQEKKKIKVKEVNNENH